MRDPGWESLRYISYDRASDIATVHGDCIFDLLSGKQLHDNEVLV